MCGLGNLRQGPVGRPPPQGQAGPPGGLPPLCPGPGPGSDPPPLVPLLHPPQPVARLLPPGAAALSDGYVYLAFARSNSPAGQVIGLFTERPFNHVSLALDRDLTTLVSYNGGGAGEAPGLNPETLAQLVHHRGACVRLYRLPATRDQKRIILRRLGKIDQEGSAYNLLGLVLPYTAQPNTMFCSQFVYGILKLAGLAYFQKDPLQVRPTDLLEWDLQGRLSFVAEYSAAAPALPLP